MDKFISLLSYFQNPNLFNKKSKKNIIIKLIIIFFSFIYIFSILFNNIIIFQNYSILKLNSYLSFKKFNKYIYICRNGYLINKNIKYFSEHIKISVVIPIFNSSYSIKSTIRSIQNQKMVDIEIIIIDDCSKDNSSSIIEKLQKEDPRIKIIKNKINRGTLFSRSIGAIHSKGKYIMSIDQDDLFINEIFNKCFKEMETQQIDIIEFSGLELKTHFIDYKEISIPFYLKFKKNNQLIKQPILSNFIYSKTNNKYQLIDGYIWGKCIKTPIYNKALQLIGKKIYMNNVCWCEDRIVNYGLFRVAFSFKFIQVYGIIHYSHINSVGHFWKKKNIDRICHDLLLNIYSIYNLNKNSKYIDIVVYELKRKKTFKYISSGLTKSNKVFLKFLFINIMKNKYLSNKEKKELNELYKNLL